MRFALTEEQATLREATRAFVATLPGPHVMAEPGAPYPAGAWLRAVEEQGWPAILVPPHAGGWGFGLLDMALVLEEAGRALVPCPLLATVALGVVPIAACGSEDQQARWLSRLAGGETATLAVDGDATATRDGSRWTLTGTKVRVVDGATADVVVVATDRGAFAVEGAVLRRRAVPTLDPTRPLATVSLDGLTVDEADRLDADGLDGALRRAEVLLAAELVGVAQATLDLTVAYAKVRVQYGRPIGSFQAVQHALADAMVRAETARTATWYAAWALDAGAPDAALAARTAKALAGDAAFRNAADAVQLHGGVGFTWEHVAHLYLKRARGSLALLGDPREHRAAVAAALLDRGEEGAWT